jgi:RNA polymerase sigma factor (sigma-70 family)
MQESDIELLRRARRDPDAYREFYDRHADAIYWWLRRRVDEPVASELTAEAFAIAWRQRGRVRDEGPQSGVRWLFGIARNLYRTYAHTQRVEQAARRRLGIVAVPSASEGDLVDIHSRVDGDAMAGELRFALDGLSGTQRRAVELRVLDELPFSEVARRLGCSEGAARVRVTRGLRALRTLLTERGAPCP